MATPASTGRPTAGSWPGVARGLAEHLGVPTIWVRIAFVLLAFSGGAGLVMYGAFWVIVPLRGPDQDVDDSPSARDRDLLVLLGVGAVAVGAASLAARQGVGSAFLVPIMVSAVGVAVLWRQGDDAQRLRWRSHASRAAGGGRAAWVRVALGVILVMGGLTWALATTGDVTQIVDGLAAGLILVAGVALVAGPWLLRLVRELTEERRERIRSQERAEIAAHVHDSVLQTLTLIQRNADDPQAVVRLARAEERALRGWLYRPDELDEGMFGAALERVAGEVEDTYAVTLEVVTVGDLAVDEPVARAAAGRPGGHGQRGQARGYGHAGRRLRGGGRRRRRGLRPRPRPRLRRRRGGRGPARGQAVDRGPHGTQRGTGRGAQLARRGPRYG